jgi:hypothetical protein
MLQAAAYGAQAFENAVKRSACDMAPRQQQPPPPPPPLPNGERAPEEREGSVGKARQANVNVSDMLRRPATQLI